jgi:hypothetical protein
MATPREGHLRGEKDQPKKRRPIPKNLGTRDRLANIAIRTKSQDEARA